MKERNKSIAFILKWHPNDAIGGAEIQAWMIAQNLAKLGWDVSYISEASQRQMMPGQENGVHLYSLPPRPHNLSFLNYFALRKIMSNIKAKIYYQRVVDSYTGFVAQIAKQQGAVSVWASSHFTLDCFPNQMQREWKLRPHRRWKGISFLPAWATDQIAEYGIRNIDQIIAQTQEQKKAIMQTWKRESIVIPNAHPVPTFVSQKKKQPIIVWLGSIKSIKRPLMFVDLAKECTDTNARFVMAGASIEYPLSTELQEYIRDVPNLSYLGPIPFEETNTLLQDASLLVSTSIGEGFSNTFIQAWLRNVPVVSFVNPDGIIEKNKLGICVSNFEQLTSNVKMLIKKPEVITEMGKYCRDYAVQEHGLGKSMDIYDKLFTKLVE